MFDNKNNIIGYEEFISLLADKAKFTKSDTKELLNAVMEVFTEAVRDGRGIKIRGFGKLHTQHIGERKGKGGVLHPPTTRTTFKLAEPIRNANKKNYIITKDESEEDF